MGDPLWGALGNLEMATVTWLSLGFPSPRPTQATPLSPLTWGCLSLS